MLHGLDDSDEDFRFLQQSLLFVHATFSQDIIFGGKVSSEAGAY